MIDVTVRFDTRDYKRQVEGFLRDQLPFATALALTRTAQRAQEALKVELRRDFTLRTKWVSKGIRIRPAKKRDLISRVGTLDSFMAPQALGGTKRARGAGGQLGVPVQARPRPRSRTPRSKWPGKLREKERHFVADLRGRGPALWRRVGRGGRRLRLMYVLEPQVRIPPRWPFLKRVERAVDRNFQREMLVALDFAVRTRR